MYGLTPVTFPLPRLNRRTTSSPNVSSATARLNAFSFGYRDAVPLTGVLYQKPLSRPVRAIALPADTLGGLVLEKVLPHQRRTRKCDIFALKRGGNDGLHYRYDRRKKRRRECGNTVRAA